MLYMGSRKKFVKEFPSFSWIKVRFRVRKGIISDFL